MAVGRMRCCAGCRWHAVAASAFDVEPSLAAAGVLAVLVFFTLRPGKGWLRRQSGSVAAGAATAFDDGSSDRNGSLGGGASAAGPGSTVEGLDTVLLSSSGGGDGELHAALLTASWQLAPVGTTSAPMAAPAAVLTAHTLPPSYITSAGPGSNLANAASSGALIDSQTASRPVAR